MAGFWASQSDVVYSGEQGRQKAAKPEPRKRTKARKQREDAKALKAFRDAVWAREEIFPGMAKCQRCHLEVYRHLFPVGEVHHRIGRRNKVTRYDPANGVLLCGALGNDCHGKAQRHEIEV